LITVSKRGSLVFVKRNLLNCIYLKEIIPFIFFFCQQSTRYNVKRKKILPPTQVYIYICMRRFMIIYLDSHQAHLTYMWLHVSYTYAKKKKNVISSCDHMLSIDHCHYFKNPSILIDTR
jgi:hypothetical protein